MVFAFILVLTEINITTIVTCMILIIIYTCFKNLATTVVTYVVIIGSEELQRGVATLKDMRSGEQREVSFEELASAL